MMRKDATKPGGSEANPPRATGGPTLVRSPGKEFYDKLAPARTQAAKGEVKKSDSASVVEDLKSFTGGFDNELEAMLKLLQSCSGWKTAARGSIPVPRASG